jgi:hypothetical protein
VPPQLGNLSRLLYLDLNPWFLNNDDGNNLHVDDISWLPRLPWLRFLDMSSVNLSTIGNFVQEVSMLSNLRVLRLSECEIVFPHTPIVRSNLTSLQLLDLSRNLIDTLNPSYWFWDYGWTYGPSFSSARLELGSARWTTGSSRVHFLGPQQARAEPSSARSSSFGSPFYFWN